MLNIEPKRVFHYFEEISKIPRGSGNEKAISDYLKNFAEENNFEVIQDDLLNIIIKKNASKGYENAPTVILQGHMDMVCEKGTASTHDFLKDGIELVFEDGFLRANNTTLGADDGVAVAMVLAILEDKSISHPPLEILITTSEETDMSGALGLSGDVLNGRLMINIDSEEEGILTVGSAGGTGILVTREIATENFDADFYEIQFDGLLGGHSGMQIHENRGNSIKIMAYFLNELRKTSDYRINSFNAGTVDNAIPRSGKLVLQIKDFSKRVEDDIIEATKKKFIDVSGELTINVKRIDDFSNRAWTKNLSDSVIDMIRDIPVGVNSFVGNTKLVESSDNLALIKEKDNKIQIDISIRSSNISVQGELVDKCVKVLEKFGFEYRVDSGYPGWEYSEESYLRDTAEKVYRDLYSKDCETLVVHAGLECGAIAEKYPGMDMISLGPNIHGAHTPKEKLEIASTKRVYDYLLKLLESIQ